jgi:hypothetical protein
MPDVKSPKQVTSISQLSDYVQGLANGNAQSGTVLTESYIAELRNADKQQARWRRIYYEWRGFVLVASAVITVLTAINLHGTLAFAFRATTLVLSALVTVFTGLLELLQVNNRWRIYRQLRSTLEGLGWQTAVDGATAPPASAASALTNLGNGLMTAMRSFEAHYISQVAAVDTSADEESQKKRNIKSDSAPRQEQGGGEGSPPAN